MTAGSEGSEVFDFTSLDFASVEADLIRYAQSIFPSDVWSDFNESNEGRRLIELMAYATELVAYSENAHALETIVASTRVEQNFRNIAKGFDFALKSASPSQTTLRFTLDAGFLPVAIPDTFKVSDASGIIFQPNVSGVATTTTYDVEATQGDGIAGEALATSDGTANQVYQLSTEFLIDGTLTVLVNASAWTKITNFIEALSTDEVYTITTDQDGVTSVNFGDGINGKVPPIGAAITADYKTGGGQETNFPTGAINRLVSSLPGVISVTNIEAAEGGGAKQSLENARRQLALSIKANDRAVTLQDYATIAIQSVSGVLDAIGVAGNFQAGGNPVILYVVPNGGGSVPDVLANQIVSTLRFGTGGLDFGRSMAGRRIFVRSALYVDLRITVDVFVNQGSSRALVGARVRDLFESRYALGEVGFGEAVSTQDAYNTADPVEQGIDGLTRIFLRKFTVDPNSGRYTNTPTTGDGGAEGIVVSTGVRRREWNIRITGSTTFAVYQRRLGTVSAVSDLFIEDNAAVYETNELVGSLLHLREQEQDEVWSISSNTQTIINITGISSPSGLPGMLVVASPGDSYAVEFLDAVGTIARAVASALATSGTPTVLVPDTTGFNPGDKVLVRDLGTNQVVLEILSIVPNTSITFTTNLTFNVPIGGTLDWFWESTDGTAGFAVVNGSTPFVAGDEFYVDTYADVGDIQLRPENYLLLDSDNLVINTIGGR